MEPELDASGANHQFDSNNNSNNGPVPRGQEYTDGDVPYLVSLTRDATDVRDKTLTKTVANHPDLVSKPQIV